MLVFIAKRLLWMLPFLIAVSFLSFVLIQLPPGDYVTTYIATLAPLIAKLRTDAVSFVEFPALHEGMIALLGISHAGFLVNKGVAHTKP